MYIFETVYGADKPKEIDTESSQYVVYIRKNIEKYQETDEQDQVIFDGWKYDEAVLPNNDYISDKLKEQQETFEALMLGIADLYEMQLGV